MKEGKKVKIAFIYPTPHQVGAYLRAIPACKTKFIAWRLRHLEMENADRMSRFVRAPSPTIK